MRPEQVIRRYLDDHGGTVDAHIDHLLLSFQLDELTPEAQSTIAGALAEVGVSPDPPLGQIGPDGRLSLRLSDENGAEAAQAGVASAGDLELLLRAQGVAGEVSAPSPTEPEPEAGAEQESLAAELEATRSARLEAARELEAAHVELGRIKSELAEVQERLRDAEAERDRLVAQGRRLREDVATAERGQSELLEKQTAALQDLHKERLEKREISGRLDSLSRSEAALHAELARAHEEAEHRLTGGRRERDEAQRALEAARAELGDVKSRLEQVRGGEAEVHERLGAAEADLERERQRNRALTRHLDDLQREHAESAEQLARERAEREAAARRMGDALVRVLELRGPVASAREEFEAAREEHERLSAALLEAERRLEHAEARAAEIRGRALDNRNRRAELERSVRKLTTAQREAAETAVRQREKLAQLGPRLEFARSEAQRLAAKADDLARRLNAAIESEDGHDARGLRRMSESEAAARSDAEVRRVEATRLDKAVADARGRLARFEETATEKRAQLEQQRSELSRLKAKDADATGHGRLDEVPEELRAEVARLRPSVEQSRPTLQGRRTRLADLERQLEEAQAALEQEVARGSARHSSARLA